MSFNVFAIILVFVLILLLYLQHKSVMSDQKKFYDELKIGDKFDHVTDGNVFIQPVEVLTVLDKKDGYIKYSVEIRKTGEIVEKSCSCGDFYGMKCEYMLVRRKK